MLDLKSPISVVWEITNNCNFLCPHCRAYQKYEKEDEELENKIIDELIKSEVLLVNISGGEPLLNPRIFKIVKKLSDNNIHVGISTNGWFYEKYRNEIKDSGVKFVQVSLDGPFEKHEKFRGIKGSYDRAIRALELARDDGMFTQMNVTITSNNIDTLKWNYDKAKELGINRVFYRRVVPTGKAEENKFVLPLREEYYKSIVELANLNSEKLVVSIDDPILPVLMKNTNENHLGCGAGINNLGISSDGNVYPCIFLRTKIGNLKEDSLLDIWNNSEVLKNLRNRKISICGNCLHKNSCGGCRAFSGIYEKDDMCPLS